MTDDSTLLFNIDTNRSNMNKLRIFYYKKIREIWLTYRWLIVGFLWTITLITGYIGYQRYFISQGVPNDDLTPDNILYQVLQLFVLQTNFSPTTPLDWTLQIARFLAPVLVALAGVQAFLYVFSDQIDNFRLRFTKNHTIICGLGNRGLAIANSFIELGEKITVIDNDLDNVNVKYLRRKGARVIQGDGTSIDILKRLRAHYCRYIFTTMRDDGENVEVAVNLYQLVTNNRKPLNPNRNRILSNNNSTIGKVQCLVKVLDPQLRNLLKQHSISTNPYDLFELSFFNTYENAVNLLFREPELIKFQKTNIMSNSTLNIVIFGLGQMGQEVFLISLKVFESLGKNNLRFTIIDKEADKKISLMLKRYPYLDYLCAFKVINADINESEFFDSQVWSIENKNTETIIFICFDADNVGVSLALSLLPILKKDNVPIFVQTNADAGLATILRSKEIFRLTGSPIVPFGIMNEICNKGLLINPKIDFIAKKFHENYIEHQKVINIDASTNHFTDNWDFLSEERKDSYRQKVKTVEIFLNIINYRIIPKNSETKNIATFNEEESLLLGKMEHSRWLVDRILNGWRFEKGRKNMDLKTNPFLVEWTELSEGTKKWNIDQMKQIPEILDSCQLMLEKF
ncbi:MAG: potassium channel family protein [Candidatus Thorarchaeota archaeon]